MSGNQQTVNSRIAILVKMIGTQQEVASRIGITRGALSVIARNTDLKVSTVQSLLMAYPWINPDWLMLGEGSVRRDGMDYESGIDLEPVDAGQPQTDISPEEIEALRKRISELEYVVDTQKKLITRLERG